MLNKNNIVKKIDNFKTLPVYFPPPLTVYLYLSQFLMMILCREEYHDWFYYNFIQLCFDRTKGESLIFYMPNQMDCQNSFPLNVYRLQDAIFDISRINLVEDIINWIDNGYYVRCDINERDIPGTFLNRDYLHQIFIFGYNKEERRFITVNFDKNRNYIMLPIDFDILEKVFIETAESGFLEQVDYTSRRENARKYFIILYKTEQNDNYKACRAILKENLENYINSVNLNNKFAFISNTGYRYWGTDIYTGIMEYLETISVLEHIDIRIFHGLYEHKKIIHTIMLDTAKQKDADPVCADYSVILEKAFMLRNLSFIVMKKSRYETVDKMKSYLAYLAENEQSIIRRFIDSLDTL